MPEDEKEVDEVIWAVSDTHLGVNVTKETKDTIIEDERDSNYEVFAEFLNYAINKEKFEVEGRTFSRPTKLLLLGDILELNDPYKDEFKYPLIELFKSLEDLQKLSPEIWYITGNHDQAMESYNTTQKDIDYYKIKPNLRGYYPIQKPKFRIIPQLKKKYKNKYNKDKDPRLIKVGDKEYYFQHGHEFNKWQIRLGWIPGILQRINQINNDIYPRIGGLLPVALSIMTFKIRGPWLFVSGFFSVFAIAWLEVTFGNPLWGTLRRITEKISLLDTNPKYKGAEELVKKKYYNPKKDDHPEAITVYGHTHMPEIYTTKPEDKIDKTFINTGGWMNEAGKKDSNGDPVKQNILVVIDKEGALLLKWEGKDKGFTLLDKY